MRKSKAKKIRKQMTVKKGNTSLMTTGKVKTYEMYDVVDSKFVTKEKQILELYSEYQREFNKIKRGK